MGAGSKTDHHIQDTAEKYLVATLQQIATDRGLALDDTVSQKRDDYIEYASSRSMLDLFLASEYKANIDAIANSFFDDLVAKYPAQQFSFVDVERDARNDNSKQDMVILISGGVTIPVSVKNYKNGFNSIQLFAGTFVSAMNNFAFSVPAGVGSYINPTTNKKFKGATKAKRDEALTDTGLACMIPVYDDLERIGATVKQFYVESPTAQHWKDIAEQWEADCSRFGHQAAEIIIRGLNMLPNDTIRQQIIRMAGLDSNAELLVMGKGRYMSTITNDKYADLVTRLTHSTSIRYNIHQKGIMFYLVDNIGDIVSVYVPLTLNKNGGWNLDGDPYEGTKLHESETRKAKKPVYLAYGERRPKKSKEIATSTNTFLDLKKAGVL